MIIGKIYAIILFIMAIIGYKKEKKIYNPMTVYSGLWAIILFVSSYEYLTLTTVDDLTYHVIFLGVSFFLMGYYLSRIRRKRNWHEKLSNDVSLIEKEYNYRRVIQALSVLSLAFFSYLSLRVLRLTLSGVSYGTIRNMYQGKTEQALLNGIETLLEGVVFGPLINALFIIVCIIFIKSNGKKCKVEFFVLMVSNLLASYVTASRFTLMYLIVSVIVSALVLKNFSNEKVKRKIKIGVITVFSVFMLMTIIRGFQRSTLSSTILTSFYYYISTPVYLLNRYLHFFDGTYTYGTLSIYGFLDILDSIIKYSSGIDLTIFAHTKEVLESFGVYYQLFTTSSMNGFVTIFFYFFKDLGYFGVAIGNFLFGFFSQWVFKKSESVKNIRYIALFTLVIQIIIQSIVRWPFSRLYTCMVLIYVLFFTSKKKLVLRRRER